MYTNEILERKWATQRKLAKEANYDIEKLEENNARKVKEIEKKYKLHFKISNRYK